jgi:hypothetical protein
VGKKRQIRARTDYSTMAGSILEIARRRKSQISVTNVADVNSGAVLYANSNGIDQLLFAKPAETHNKTSWSKASSLYQYIFLL